MKEIDNFLMQARPISLSVVIPNFNHADHLPRCLEAVLSQSYAPSEIILIDDGSTDNSVEVIQSYAAKHPVIRFFQNDKNRGVVYTMDRGLRLATGDYVSFAGADDQVMPGLFEKTINLLSQHRQAAFCGTIVEFRQKITGQTYHQGTKISDVPCFISPKEMVDLSRRDRLILFTSTMVLRRNALLEVGGFFPEFKWHTDWFTFFIPAFRYGFCFVPEVLGEFTVLPASYSKKGMRDRKVQTEVLRNILEMLLKPDFADVLPAIKRSGILAPFGKEMFMLLLSNKRYRSFLSPTYFKNAFWWIARIELKKVLPRFVTDLYFRLAGYKVSESKSLPVGRNEVAKPASQ